MPVWQRRLVLTCLIVGGTTALVVLAGMTWAIFAIREDRAGMQRIPATVVSVDSSQRSSFGRSVHFGKYSLTVRYKDSDGREVTSKIDETTFGFPSVGDSITLLIHPSGNLERDPIGEVILIVALVYAFFGWLVWQIVKSGMIRAIRER